MHVFMHESLPASCLTGSLPGSVKRSVSMNGTLTRPYFNPLKVLHGFNSKKREQPSVSFSSTPAKDQPATSPKTKYQLSENKTKHRGKEYINLSALFWRRLHVGREELWSVSLNSVKSRNAQNDGLLCNVTNL